MRLENFIFVTIAVLEGDIIAIIVGKRRALESLCSSHSTPYGSLFLFAYFGCSCNGSIGVLMA